jgi:hypothetical protein
MEMWLGKRKFNRFNLNNLTPEMNAGKKNPARASKYLSLKHLSCQQNFSQTLTK